VPVQDRMDCALGRNAEVLIQPPNQQFSDLASAPIGLLALQATMSRSICPGSWLA
jgi:hypothetical protein